MQNYSLHNRKSIRLKNYDYSEPGDYFVTVCAKNRKNLFGEVVSNKMILSEVGEIINRCWLEIPKHFSNVELDISQIMPNHLHGILEESISDPIVGNSHGCSLQGGQDKRQYQKLPVIVSQFKSSVVRICNQNDLSAKWQKSYYDHIIRNEKSYDKIYDYIELNIGTWQEDVENLEFNKGLVEKLRNKKAKDFYENLLK